MLGGLGQAFVAVFRHGVEHLEHVLDRPLAAGFVGAGHGQKRRVPGDLRARGDVVVAHDLARAGQELEHVGKQVDVALLHRPFLGGRGRAAGHGVLDHVVVDALEVGGGIAVVIGHDLLEHEVGGTDHVLVGLGQGHGHAEVLLDVGRGGEHLALAVPAHGRAERGVHDVAAGRGRRAHGRHEQAIGVVAMVVEDEFGVGLADGRDHGRDEPRRTHAGHVLETQDDALRRLGLGHAAGLGHLVEDGLEHAHIVGDVEALGVGKRDGRLENDAGA